MDKENIPQLRQTSDGSEYMVFRGQSRKILFRVPFVYQVPIISNLAAGATANPVNVLIDSGSDFMWQQGCYQFDLANAAYTYSTRPIPNMSVLINDSGSSRNLQNSAVPVEQWFGPVEKPMTLLLPYLFNGAATVAFTLTNTDAAVNTGNLRLSLKGQQIYYV